MKLLFDENLSPKLPRLLGDLFPESVHVRDCGLTGKTDQDIWDHARDNGFTLVSKDADFYQRSLLLGAPPRLLWLCLGNCSRTQIVNLLHDHKGTILAWEFAAESVLILS